MKRERYSLYRGTAWVSVLACFFIFLSEPESAKADSLSPGSFQTTPNENTAPGIPSGNPIKKSSSKSSKAKKKPQTVSPVPAGPSENRFPTAVKKPSGISAKKKNKKVSSPPLSKNGPDALAAYRHGWNPITGGPEFLPLADTLPEGELNGRMFFYSRFTEAQYTGSGGIQSLPNGYYETQLLLLGAIYYGLTSNDELVLLPSMISTFSTSDGQSLYGTGFNDFTFGIKHRWIIQDPNSWRPSIATPFLISLPTSTWLGTPVPKGGLPPLSVVPSTHFGSLALTTGLFVRKNAKPFRYFSDFYYTFTRTRSSRKRSFIFFALSETTHPIMNPFPRTSRIREGYLPFRSIKPSHK